MAIAVRNPMQGEKTHSVWIEEYPSPARVFERDFPDFGALALSPDAEFLAVAAGGKLTVLAWRNGETRDTVALTAAVASMTWHPSGREIVCSADNARADAPLLRVDLDAGTWARLPASGTHPQFSPDGRSLYLLLDRELHVLPWPLDGTPPQQVLDIAPVHTFALSPDGTRVFLLVGSASQFLAHCAFPVLADLPPGRRRYAPEGEHTFGLPAWCAWMTEAPGQPLAHKTKAPQSQAVLP